MLLVVTVVVELRVYFFICLNGSFGSAEHFINEYNNNNNNHHHHIKSKKKVKVSL
jgi:hypothetical protein